jgi:hypothetical protein
MWPHRRTTMSRERKALAKWIDTFEQRQPKEESE